ncbi:MAG: InlB B-repeat-containing protein [Mogibacterium sp.]|nr:InlB B-repeat-containing protein [Mogibacterium sp.]
MRQTPDKLRALAAFLKGKMNMRSLVMTLAVLVVFVTTYLLILPAFTLEKDEAVRQGGIDVVAIESAAENEDAAETETAEATADVKDDSDTKTDAEDKDSTDTDTKDDAADADKSEKTTSSDAKSADVKVLTSEDGLTAEGEGFVVQATTENKTEVPANTELQVAEVSDNTDELKEYREAALTALKDDDKYVKDIKEIKVYDMSLQAEGESVKTDSKFNVKIEYEEGVKVEDADNVRVLTFDAENKAAVLDAEDNKVETKVESAGKKSNVTEASFETEGISKVAVVEVETLEKTIVADGKTYKVTVKYNKDAGIPDGSTLEVSELKGDAYDAYLEKTASKLGKSADELADTKFFDITIKNGDEEVKIANPVNVSIQLVGSDNLAESTQVLHFADENKADLVDSKVSGDTVKFSADGFSVYAVVDTGDQGENARMTVEFYDDTTKIASMIVKNSDTAEEIEHILYDPGAGTMETGELFKGWIMGDPDNDYAMPAYTTDDVSKAMTIQDIRAWAEARTITEHETIKFYAMKFKTFAVSFKDEDGSMVHSEALITGGNTATYLVNQEYTPKSEDAKFEGWYWEPLEVGSNALVTNADGVEIARNTPIPNGTTIQISGGSVVFRPNPATGFWLSFMENGKGATYTPPQFIKTNDVTVRPDNPSRLGYEFAGWYTNPEGTGQQFTFGNTISGRTTLYAKWTPVATAPYTVIIWQQQTTGDKYDFIESIPLTGNTNTTVNSVSQQGNGNNTYARINGANYRYDGFHLKEFDQNVTITPEGNAVVNVYYDRNEYTLSFVDSDNPAYGYTQNNNGNYGKVGDTYVRLSNGNTRYYLAYSDGTPVPAGTAVYYRANGWFSTYWDNTVDPTSTNTTYYAAENYNTQLTWTRYTGSRYTRTQNSTVKTITARYGANIASNFPIVGDNGITYNNGERWDPQDNSQGWTEVMVHVETMPDENITFNIDRAERPLKTMYYYVEALPSDTTNIVTRGGVRYVLHNTVRARYNGVTEEDFIELEGFTKSVAAETVNGQALSPHSVSGLSGQYYIASTTQDQSIYFFYTRDKYKIVYNDGRYVDGNGNVLDEAIRKDIHESGDIYYGASLADQKNEYKPTLDEYEFAGWYLDDACTQPFDFDTSTMPKGGIQLYAKWVQKQYRVFMHPNVPTSESLEWGQTDQQMSYRVSYGEKVSGGHKVVGIRDGGNYELIGWYTDPGFTNAFNFDAYVLRDDTVDINGNPLLVDYSKTENTELDDYGNPSETGNKDSSNNRFWVNKKLDLYAKWRSVIVGAPGINVEYDAVLDKGQFPNGSIIYTDPLTYYLDRAEATAAAASNALSEDEQFLHWVVQKWDDEQNQYVDVQDSQGEDVIVYPGDTFEVLKAYAREEDIPEHEATDTQYKRYTVRLRAEYGKKQSPTPTHIYWYANNDSEPGADPRTNEDYMVKTFEEINGQQSEFLEINKGFPIMPADTFEYEGHKFLGWARITEPESGYEQGDYVRPDVDRLKNTTLDDADLYLKYDKATGKFQAYIKDNDGNWAWTNVAEVAADEKQPYHDMFAVWGVKTFNVDITKEVSGSDADKAQSRTYEISYRYQKTSGEEVNGSVNLYHGQTTSSTEGQPQTITEVPYGTIITVTEAGETEFDKTYSATHKVDVEGEDEPQDQAFDPEPESTEGAVRNRFKITLDTTIKVTNTRKSQQVMVKKTDMAGAVLEGAEFKLNGTTYTSGSDGFLKENGETKVFELNVGSHNLSETTSPAGYIPLQGDVIITVEAQNVGASIDGTVTQLDCVKDPETGIWTVTVTNSSGQELPMTGGIGTTIFYILGSLLVIGCGVVLISRKRAGSGK